MTPPQEEAAGPPQVSTASTRNWDVMNPTLQLGAVRADRRSTLQTTAQLLLHPQGALSRGEARVRGVSVLFYTDILDDFLLTCIGR